MTSRCLAVSAVNFTEGGPLSILRDFVAVACETLPSEWQIVVFVHDRRLLEEKRAVLIEIPAPKHSWLRRMHMEWFGFRSYAKALTPDLWVSLHDMTPSVGRTPQAVYCHNPVPFYGIRWRDVWFDPRILTLRLLYGFLYRINIRRNVAVVVQQAWLRERFKDWVGSATKIIVAHPVSSPNEPTPPRRRAAGVETVSFLYPSLPRVFKNIELICRAVEHLERNSLWRSHVLLTIDGTENRYARWLKRRFGHLHSLRLLGRQSQQQMRVHYAQIDCLLFPSLMETWGLPITEAKMVGLPMFIADLPYAHEALGSYDQADFIDVHDPAELGRKMLSFQLNTHSFAGARGEAPGAPFAASWKELLLQLLP